MDAIQSAQSSSASLPIDDPGLTTVVVSTGDPGAEMAALAIENGEAERTNAHQERDAQEAAEAQANAAEVQKMHDEASSMRSEGVFDAVVGVAAAAATVALPIAFAADPAAPAATMAQSQAGAARAGTVGGGLVDSFGKLGDGFFHAAQHNDEAGAAADRASAGQHGDAVKDANDTAASADATISSALDFDRSYSSVEGQIQLAALHRA